MLQATSSGCLIGPAYYMARRLEISEPRRKTDRGVDEIRAPHFVTEYGTYISNAYSRKAETKLACSFLPSVVP